MQDSCLLVALSVLFRDWLRRPYAFSPDRWAQSRSLLRCPFISPFVLSWRQNIVSVKHFESIGAAVIGPVRVECINFKFRHQVGVTGNENEIEPESWKCAWVT